VKADIAKTEADRLFLQARARSRLEEIEREKMAEVTANTRLARSRAPSPEPCFPSARAEINNLAMQTFPSRAERLDNVCRAETFPESRQSCTYHHQSYPKPTEIVGSKPLSKKIIWKVTYKADSLLPTFSTSAIPSSTPIPTNGTQKRSEMSAKSNMKLIASNKYIWEEYDHSEVFEEPDNPNDEDYDPEIED